MLYRLRNIIKDGLTKEKAFQWDPAFRPLCAHLTENLYKYRIFLPEKVFDALHEYKHLAQDALLMMDISTRKENVFDREKYKTQIIDFQKRFEDSEEAFHFIDTSLRERFKVK